MSDVRRSEMDKILEEVMKLLMKQRLLPEMAPPQMNDLKMKVADSLEKDGVSLTFDAFNEETSRSVGLACMAQLTNDQCVRQENKFDIKLLFQNLFHLKKDTVEEKIKEQLKNIFTEMLQLKLGKNKQITPDMQRQIDEMATLLAKQFAKDDVQNLSQNKACFNLMVSLMQILQVLQPGRDDSKDDLLRQLFGTSKLGEIALVRGIVGDQMGILNRVSGSQGGFSFRASADNPIGPIPQSIRIYDIVTAVANGSNPDITSALASEHMIPAPSSAMSPFSTTLIPPTSKS